MSTSTLKSLIRPLIPAQILERWRRYRYEAEQAHYKDRPLDEVFKEIYDSHAWDRDGSTAPYRSGPGSMPEVTAAYEAFVIDYLMRHPEIETLVDIGCGDFQVSGRILDALSARSRPIRYVGCDIAANVVAYNTATFSRPGVSFQTLDATRELPPPGDLVTVREVFQHLSNAHIAAMLANLAQRYRQAIVTESISPGKGEANVDIVSGYRTRDGYGSGVFVDKPPFNLEILEEHTTLASPSHKLRTTVVSLIERSIRQPIATKKHDMETGGHAPSHAKTNVAHR